MNITQLYQDHSIPYWTEGKNISEGWVATSCPFCQDTSNHLGYNLDGDYFSCWKCGSHPIIETISKLLQIRPSETHSLIRQYNYLPEIKKELQVKLRVKSFKLPSNSAPLQEQHRKYLERRGFDPDLLEQTWGLFGTGVYSKLDNIDYKFRIIIPYVWEGKQVSFQSRDITGKDPGRYKACPKDRELIHHKNILYGKQEAWTNKCILVEGSTDVWRFGVNSCAVSGIKYTPAQVRSLSKIFTRIAVCFDDDSQATIQANKLVAELKFRSVDAFRVDIVGDPGAMKQTEANYLVKNLLK